MRTVATASDLILLALPNEPQSDFRLRVQGLADGGEVERGGEINLSAQRQISEYLAGERKSFDLPFELESTPFRKEVLFEVARIPYGETRTYKELAVTLGRPKAARAVGSANARNPLPLIIPCHRVVAGNGLGGYGGGLDMKRRLLRLEGAG
jgi:O-6-methylguanine DNA methyltransferase